MLCWVLSPKTIEPRQNLIFESQLPIELFKASLILAKELFSFSLDHNVATTNQSLVKTQPIDLFQIRNNFQLGPADQLTKSLQVLSLYASTKKLKELKQFLDALASLAFKLSVSE